MVAFSTIPSTTISQRSVSLFYERGPSCNLVLTSLSFVLRHSSMFWCSFVLCHSSMFWCSFVLCCSCDLFVLLLPCVLVVPCVMLFLCSLVFHSSCVFTCFIVSLCIVGFMHHYFYMCRCSFMGQCFFMFHYSLVFRYSSCTFCFLMSSYKIYKEGAFFIDFTLKSNGITYELRTIAWIMKRKIKINYWHGFFLSPTFLPNYIPS
jgi:hypothetical protein